MKDLLLAVETLNGSVVELGDQVVLVPRDEFDQVGVESLALGERLALQYRRLRKVAIAAACAGDRAHGGRGVVLYFLLHHGVHLPAHGDGVSGSGVGTGRHSSNVRPPPE